MAGPDLLGNTIPQGDLFAGDVRLQGPTMDFPSEARARLLVILGEARAATVLPWPERQARKWEILFPQMAEWLPGDEANQLCFEFAQELERLRKAA